MMNELTFWTSGTFFLATESRLQSQGSDRTRYLLFRSLGTVHSDRALGAPGITAHSLGTVAEVTCFASELVFHLKPARS